MTSKNSRNTADQFRTGATGCQPIAHHMQPPVESGCPVTQDIHQQDRTPCTCRRCTVYKHVRIASTPITCTCFEWPLTHNSCVDTLTATHVLTHWYISSPHVCTAKDVASDTPGAGGRTSSTPIQPQPPGQVFQFQDSKSKQSQINISTCRATHNQGSSNMATHIQGISNSSSTGIASMNACHAPVDTFSSPCCPPTKRYVSCCSGSSSCRLSSDNTGA